MRGPEPRARPERALPWPSAATTVVGVIGDPVAHSLSPLLHNSAFEALGVDWISVGFRVPEGAAAAAAGGIRALGLAGVSVTMPHKAAMVPVMDELSPTAGRLGALNCVVNHEGRLVGHNTDGAGFLGALGAEGVEVAGQHCLVVGAGGAARAVVLALAEAGARQVDVVARRPQPAGAAAALAGACGRVGVPADAARAELVVQATPAGMAGSPAASAAPLVDPDLLGPGQVAVDLVYHPAVTPWLAAAAARGATVLGGLGMLVHQAGVQVTAWTGEPAPLAAMAAAVGYTPGSPAA